MVVRQIVDLFYDIMEEPAYARLRELHARDLTPMRKSLAGFLTAWMGGPGDWFKEHPGVCMMSAHKIVPIDGETAGQWEDAMRRAIALSPVQSELGPKLADALGGMAQKMINR